MTLQLDLTPLHNLFQTVDPASHPNLPHPLLCLAQLRRKTRSKRARTADGAGGGGSEVGEVEWVVAVGGKGQQPDEDAEKVGKKRKVAAASEPEEWWEASLCEKEVEDLMELEGCAIQAQEMVKRVKAAWCAGDMQINSYGGPGLENRGGLELVINVTETVHLPLVLEPCHGPPLSLFSILATVLPNYLTCTADRKACADVTEERDGLRKRVSHLEGKVEDYKKKEERRQRLVRVGLDPDVQPSRQNSGGADFERRGSSGEGGGLQSQSFLQQGGSYSQSSQGRGGSMEPRSPAKNAIPGQNFRGALRPGDAGYAGNAQRPGRIVEEPDFDSNSEDSDSD
ncbi:hypothetical protein JCM11251_003011 [Rhodosporidiobolus azoricus]